jgi:HTH-type transcriptional regulator / antitoxin HipB
MKSLASIVRFHRKEAGLSRNQLALLAGVGKTAIYDLEHGKQTLRWNTVMAILHALNLRIQFEGPLMQRYAASEHSSI